MTVSRVRGKKTKPISLYVWDCLAVTRCYIWILLQPEPRLTCSLFLKWSIWTAALSAKNPPYSTFKEQLLEDAKGRTPNQHEHEHEHQHQHQHEQIKWVLQTESWIHLVLHSNRVLGPLGLHMQTWCAASFPAKHGFSFSVSSSFANSRLTGQAPQLLWMLAVSGCRKNRGAPWMSLVKVSGWVYIVQMHL